ncbi:hypothetical protein CAEBREN_29243 [Caenorhabditis brenneri]|uniref:Small ribosomal subunit protein mS39 n=1 Tax=Caenorhabditis brenneri TaxID=135651 RepID=G0PBW7_CAEBE|nr:hypothetical protein CAEBREN_29243 [Caenorhabditis brenneri]
MIGRVGLGRVLSRSLSTAEVSQKLTIQLAIERSPTDLLNALSETVGPDTTAPHFAYIDDPITIPSTQSAKKTYFMAKEFGKRAARELATEWPTLFAFDRDQPRLPAFRPQHLADPLQVAPTEKSLLAMIESREVQDSCILYERMRSENVEVSEKTQMELFRLVTYYNSSNIPYSEWENWAGMRNYGEDGQSVWKSGAVADLLFETLPKTDESVSIMISGLCKYSDHGTLDRARQLYKEHRASNGKIYREAFNGLIGASSYSVAKKLAAEMASQNISPDIHTFNSLLTAATRSGKFEERVKSITEIIGEMKELGVEPALSSYHIIVKNLIDSKLLESEKRESDEQKNAYNRQLTLAVSWLNEILSGISGQALVPVTSKCNIFFVEAMGILYRTSNEKLAEQLLSIYESKTNQVKMPEFTIQSMFYNRYLQLAIEQTASLNRIYDLYTSKVALMVDNDVLAPLIPHTRRYSVKLSVINKFKIQIVWNETEKMSICLEVGEENEYLQDENFVISRQTLGLGFTHLVTSLLNNHDLEHAYFRSMTADRMEHVHAPKEVKNAPKAKRVRQSRLNLDNFSPYESNSPRPSNVAQISPLTRFNLPIQRLQFENEDFMDLYTDDNNHRPDSVAFLSQCLSDALMMEPGVSPRLSTLRPRSSLRTPESQYRFNHHRNDHTAKLTPKRTHASDKKN